MAAEKDWSTLEVAAVGGKPRLVTCKSLQPLKLLNPAPHHPSCHVVLSTYGGGMVSGDNINLRVTGHPLSRLFLGSQSNTKIFKAVDGAVATQTMEGELKAQALAVVFPDPVVLQAGSRYRQVQHWQLAPDALLFVVDWFHSGRMDQGERYVFDSFFSEQKVSMNGRLVLLDRFSFAPAQQIASSPANFDRYHTMFSAYLVGCPTDPRFQRLAHFLRALAPSKMAARPAALAETEVALAVTQAKENAYVLRAMAATRQELLPLCQAIGQIMADADLLGYNPLERKY